MASTVEDPGEAPYAKLLLSWGDDQFGLLDDVDASSLKPKYADHTIGAFGSMVIDKVIVGVEGTPTCTVTQDTAANMRKLIAGAPTSGTIPLISSAPYARMYPLCKILKIWPEDVTDESYTITLHKAFPVIGGPKSEAGDNPRKVPVSWMFFPLRTSLLTSARLRDYGRRGAAPV